jgi:hypothetical protein
MEGESGVFEINKPDKLVFSKRPHGRFPTNVKVRTIAKKV